MNILTLKNINSINYTIYRQIFNVSLSNVNIIGRNNYYPNCLLYTNQQLISPYDEKVMSLNKDTFYDNNIYHYEPIQEEYILIEEPVYFFIYNFDNYYHFMYDTLPYLYNYFELKREIPNLKLLINYPNKKKEFYQFNLDVFKILKLDYIIHNENNIYENLYLSNSLTHGGLSNEPPHPYIFSIYEKISQSISTTFKTYQKIFISRRTWTRPKSNNIGTDYTTRRKMINEDKLVEELNKLGFVEIFAEDYSLEEKIAIFSRAKVIIGAIGGGMCNLLFSPKETKTICIVSPYFLDINYRFKYSMDHTNITYFKETSVYSNTNIPMYIRVKILEGQYKDRIGEIVDYKDGKYLINLSNNDVAGFNNEIKFDQIEELEENLHKLDNGLNSPYEVNIEKLLKLI
jgi:hypothetical protein